MKQAPQRRSDPAGKRGIFMKIILICQADTDMKWEERYDAVSFERAVETELGCSAVSEGVRQIDASAYRVYTGTSRACMQTAEILFEQTGPIESTPLLDDVPIRAFRKTGRTLPLWLWKTMAGVQWRAESHRQGETIRQTERRVGQLADQLETESRDCIVICRGLTLTALKTVLRHRGFLLEGGGIMVKPLERVRATKKTLHCGGCSHNCLLTEAKCHIGREKARERGIVA